MTQPTVSDLLRPLVGVTDRGLYDCTSDDVDGGPAGMTSWADHICAGAQLAAALKARLDPEKPPHVGVLLGNTTFFSSLLVASAMSGLVPVGLNPTRRGAALVGDIQRADCQLVLADNLDLVPDGLDAAGIGVIDVESDSWATELAGFAGTPVQFVDADPDDLFMLIFTSGTSGDPKAVRVTHDKVAYPGQMLANRFRLSRDDTFYLSMPLFHSNAVMAGWAPALAAQGSIALRRKFSASGFIQDIRRYRATYANYVGKPLSYILATPPRDDDTDNPLKIMYGNEGAPRDLPVFARRFGVIVVDGFGSSEGGVAIARTPDTPPGALGPLTPEVDIVDVDTGLPCPPGVVGELVNPTGRGWFRGYYNNTEAEAQRMAGGVYHTGDLAYRDAEGFAYFAGRLGDWMRVDGENLGTAPIERVLMRFPDVVEAVVYPIPDPAVGDQVMAALLLADGTEFSVDTFTEFLHAQEDLGPKQWPRFVRLATTLPRTETFKVIKRQLSAEGTSCADPVHPIAR
ncbi:long-chain-fatty-acid--CoA ligase FadD17 [Mycobacterium sp. OTB74]|uniref:long-chain-fatty-acid--CoA ligase FadD17 n=1 Tax=Mycobacterium sp. OTB74 TaxID=1853452 RepID=UPI002474EEE5|nr:long-chain-fatty-acid--CoA ligase FadD17 [Mycobacterium sp. OTB74]MDH6243795.1 fatty-acyl-CoA synthase [Mycobacterium sp. OTB74]